jgi:thioredoxin 1
MVLKITDANYESLFLNNKKPVIIDFWAQWCGPCKSVSAALENLALTYGEEVIIGEVDVDLNPELTSKFGVRNMPTVLFIKNDEIVDKQVGSTSQMVLEEKLKFMM